MTRVIWCTPSRGDEAELIAEVSAAGCTVVRRCLEAADLLAAAAIESQAAIVIDAAVPRLGADIIATIERGSAGRTIGLFDDDNGGDRVRAFGISRAIDMRNSDARSELLAELRGEVERRTRSTASPEHSGNQSLGDPNEARQRSDRREVKGRRMVVTGPAGAPGRTTVALGLAEAWAQAGERVCLVDADTVAPSLAATVGMTEDISGLLLASRYADQGALDARSLGSACRKLSERLWVLTGIGSPDRWGSARPAALERIWDTCAEHFDRVVIDAGSLLDTPSADDNFSIGHERDAATVSALRNCDAAIVVARGEPIGTLRLIDQLPSIGKLTGSAAIHVVVNRVHKSDKFPASFAAKSVAKTVGQALLEAGSPLPVYQLREDRSIEDCVRKGALLSEVPATMRVRRSLAKLARQLAV
jgi:MinD-like ATPase involved in chromosome partitioning or flagellar assembly